MENQREELEGPEGLRTAAGTPASHSWALSAQPSPRHYQYKDLPSEVLKPMQNLETFDVITLCAKALVKDFTKTLANILANIVMHVCQGSS